MKNKFNFIIIMVMAIVCTMTANAKDVFFATHRTVQNEYGELLPKNLNEAYCPTRIEVDMEAKTLLVKTKTHGTANYTFNSSTIGEKAILLWDEKDKLVGSIIFADINNLEFNGLMIYRNDGSIVIYAKI